MAPAYLFSGTRGVGKTTIARIFAKAVNCLTAPGRALQPVRPLPPDHGRGGSGRGGNRRRVQPGHRRGQRLKEDIGYAPIECRYKVFIIDEAHMLTKEAFNALL